MSASAAHRSIHNRYDVTGTSSVRRFGSIDTVIWALALASRVSMTWPDGCRASARVPV